MADNSKKRFEKYYFGDFTVISDDSSLQNPESVLHEQVAKFIREMTEHEEKKFASMRLFPRTIKIYDRNYTGFNKRADLVIYKETLLKKSSSVEEVIEALTETEYRIERIRYNESLTRYTQFQNNIPDPTNPDTRPVIAYIENIMGNILKANGLASEIGKVQVILDNSYGNSATYYPGHAERSPLLAVNISVLKKLKSEDALAHYISHELVHHIIGKPNSKQQEITADAYAIKLMAQADYNPQPVIDDCKISSQYSFDKQSSFEHVTNDDHASEALNLREMENTKAVMERTKGIRYEDQPLNFIPDEILDIIKQAPTKSSAFGAFDIERFDHNYNKADTAGKLRLLQQLTDIELPDFGFKYITDKFKDFKFNANDPEQLEHFEKLVDYIVDNKGFRQAYHDATICYLRSRGDSEEEIARYKAVLSKMDKQKVTGNSDSMKESPKIILLGKAGKLERAIKGFISATSDEEIISFAEQINLAKDNNYFSEARNFLTHFEIDNTGFILEQIKKHGHYTLPYHRHLKCMVETKNADVLHALVTMGLHSDKNSYKIIRDIAASKNIIISQKDIYNALGLTTKGIDSRSLSTSKAFAILNQIVHEKGLVTELSQIVASYRNQAKSNSVSFTHNIAAYKQMDLTEIAAEEENFVLNRHLWEEELVQNTDWSQVRTDLIKFLDNYSSVLEPDPYITTYNRGSIRPFAERFVREISSLANDEGNRLTISALKEYLLFRNYDKKPGFIEQGKFVLDSYKNAVKNNHYLDDEETEELFKKLSPDHPLVKFVIDDPLKIFNELDKIALLDNYQVLNRRFSSRISLDNFFINPLRILPSLTFNYSSEEELARNISLSSVAPDNHYNKKLYTLIVQNFLDSTELAALSPEALTLLLKCSSYDSYIDTKVKYRVLEKISQSVKDLIRNDPTAREIADYYVSLMGLSLLETQPFIRSELTKALLNGMRRAEASEIEYITQKLVHIDRESRIIDYDGAYKYISFYYEGNIEDNELREVIVKRYTQLLVKELGTDDGSPEYNEKLITELEKIKQKLSSQIFGYLLPELAHQIEAQKETAKLLQKNFFRNGIEATMSEQVAGKYAEFFTYEITKDKLARLATIDFLTYPLSTRSLETYLSAVRNCARKENSVYYSFYYNNSSSATEKGLYIATLFHKNFWTVPLEFRVWYLEKQLFPVHNTDESTVSKTTDEIVNRVLPLNKSLSDDSLIYDNFQLAVEKFRRGRISNNPSKGFDLRSTQVARAIVTSYFKVIPVAEQRLLATTMLVADNAGILNENPSVGRTLYIVLSRMGPAGAKLLQAIHSHPQTPQQLKDELAACKTNHNRTYRWDVIENFHNEGVLTRGHKLAAEHIGPVMASASLGIAVKNTLADGSEVVDTLLRPDSRNQSLLEFENMSKAIDLVIKEMPELDFIRDMIAEATRSIEIETYIPLAEKQNQTTQQVLDNIRITVLEDGQTFNFKHRIAPFIATGKELKRTELMKGVHFIDLPESTEEQRRYKRAAAKATLLPLIAARLAGLPCERDRHGGNFKVNGEEINHYDTAAQELTLPTAEQMRALGQVMGAAIGKAFGPDIQKAAFEKVIVDEMDRMKASPEVRAFLAGVKREFLAQSDCRCVAGVTEKNSVKHDLALKPMELLEIIAVVAKSELIHPDIAEGLKDGLGDKFEMSMMVIGMLTPSIHMEGFDLNLKKFKEVELTDQERELIKPNLEVYSRELYKHKEREKPADTMQRKGTRASDLVEFCQSEEWQKAYRSDIIDNRKIPNCIDRQLIYITNFKGDFDAEVFFLAINEIVNSRTSFIKEMARECPNAWREYKLFTKAHGFEIAEHDHNKSPTTSPPKEPVGPWTTKLIAGKSDNSPGRQI